MDAPSVVCWIVLDVETGLAAESAPYSVLQAGPEFAAWRADTTPQPETSDQPAVTFERLTDDTHIITLDRLDRHDAITDTRSGPSCFAATDHRSAAAATAHVTSLARLLHRLRPRLTVHTLGWRNAGAVPDAV